MQKGSQDLEWKGNPGQGVCAVRESCSRTDVHQAQQYKDKDMSHLSTTARETPCKFYSIS